MQKSSTYRYDAGSSSWFESSLLTYYFKNVPSSRDWPFSHLVDDGKQQNAPQSEGGGETVGQV